MTHLLTIIILLFVSTQAYSEIKCSITRGTPGILEFAKFDKTAANAGCMATINSSDGDKIKKVFKANNLRASGNFNPNETHAFAEVINTIDKISDGRFKLHKNFKAKYQNHGYKGLKVINSSTCRGSTLILRNTNQGKKFLNETRNSFDTGRNNVAHIAHEIAHCFGHNKPINNKKIYQRYKKTVKDPCIPTWYSSCNYLER